MPATIAYRSLRLRILAALGAGAVAAAVGSACDTESNPDVCLDLDDADAVCPSVEEASVLLDDDTIEDFDARFPERDYEAEGKHYVYPAQCCYITTSAASSTWDCSHGFGRPLLAGTHSLVAHAERRNTSWIRRNRRLPHLETLDIATRHALGKSWLERALMEHAAVVSFARFGLELMALGAPPDLVREASRSGAEEVDHAELCFAFAEAYRGEAWGPGPLATPPIGAVDAPDFAARLAIEGCIHETIGVAELEARVSAAQDPVVRNALRRLAVEETRHAALGWRALAWIARRDERARVAAATAFRRYGLAVLEHEPPGPDPEHPLAAHGEITEEQRQQIARACFLDVIVPAARRVCAAPAQVRSPSAESAA